MNDSLTLTVLAFLVGYFVIAGAFTLIATYPVLLYPLVAFGLVIADRFSRRRK